MPGSPILEQLRRRYATLLARTLPRERAPDARSLRISNCSQRTTRRARDCEGLS